MSIMEQKAQANPGLIGYNFFGLSLNAYRAQKRERAEYKTWVGDVSALLYLYYQAFVWYTSIQRHISLVLCWLLKSNNSRRTA
jgi:hypothetical protein